MKKILFALAICLSTAAVGEAARINAQQALEAAQSFLAEQTASPSMLRATRPSLVLAHTPQGGEYYAFNAQDAEGYVLMAADDRMPAVLGYSDEGHFDAENMPENMRAWLADYAEQVRYVQSHPEVKVQASSSRTAGNVYPLLGNTKWNQGAPYNNMCPTYTKDGATKRAVTGCAATAMAQVMYYHRWPDVGTGSHSYSCALNGDESQRRTITADFSKSRYDWNNMLPAYSGSETSTQNSAVAQLMYDCGVALNMGYGASSGAVTRIAMNRLATYFKYDKSIRAISRDAYDLDSWLYIINNELKENRPVIHTGASESGGHAFVIDGCNPSGYYHVNWGWGGSSNGYFVLTDLTPTDQGIGSSEGGYNLRQMLIYSIKPDQGSPVGYSGCISNFYCNNSQVDLGSKATFVWNGYHVITSGSGNASVRFGIGITDKAGKLLSTLGYSEASAIEPNKSYTRNMSVTIPASLESGVHYIVPLIAPPGTTNYRIMDVSRASNPRIAIQVMAGTAYFRYPSNKEELSVNAIEHSDVLAANRAINVKATIGNTGYEFVNNLCIALLDANGAVAATSVPKRIDVQKNCEAVLESTVMPTRAGTYKLAVIYAADSTVVEGQQPTLSIASSPAAFNMAITKQLSLASTTLPSTHIEGKVSLYNNGGDFAGRIEAMILGATTSSIQYRVYSDFITIKKGETKEVRLVGTFTRGEAGQKYRIALRNPKYTTSNTIWGNTLTFTLRNPVKGDVNVDGSVNVSDVTTLINAVLGIDAYPLDRNEADINGDGELNVSDVTALINRILGN
ncbi:MAG: C10 family peptidase [Bacteroidales bacterium]|nr:C10 family peptidase [Bacteroidales bacterium]